MSGTATTTWRISLRRSHDESDAAEQDAYYHGDVYGGREPSVREYERELGEGPDDLREAAVCVVLHIQCARHPGAEKHREEKKDGQESFHYILDMTRSTKVFE